jgi:hypothetical protein
MNNQPDTETDELAYALIDALPEILTDHEDLISQIAEPLAAIRRHAAADALKQQAKSFAKLGAFNQTQERALASKGDTRSANIYAIQSEQCYRGADRLRRAAADLIAEGYEHTCASFTWATRSDPGYGCDAPVETEGEYCSKHEPEDDDRDAE